MHSRIKKGDTIIIISGKDRGREAKVLKVFPSEEKILAEGINLKKIHRRPRRAGEKGSVVEIHTPIFASKALPKCKQCGKAVRVSYGKSDGGRKNRICKKCKAEF